MYVCRCHFEQLRRSVPTGIGGSPDNSRDHLVVVAGVDALGAEGHEDVGADLETPRAEWFYQKLASAPDVCRRGQHDRLTGHRM